MSRHIYTQSAQSPGALTPEQVERVRTALHSAAGEYAEALALGAEELEERIMPGLNIAN
jgi:hypothetical protein